MAALRRSGRLHSRDLPHEAADAPLDALCERREICRPFYSFPLAAVHEGEGALDRLVRQESEDLSVARPVEKGGTSATPGCGPRLQSASHLSDLRSSRL